MSDLLAWLHKLEQRTPKGNFELGLERINQVKEKLDLKINFPIISVAGTNGKGSCCCFLESILTEAGFKPGCFYSPHLINFKERIKVNGISVNDEELINAFKIVEAADNELGDNDKPLSYFEFIVLAAMICFINAKCQAVILEVGLGGRLDATNTFAADVAIITSIGIDHVEYLGDTREKIGYEKAGIIKKNIPVVIGDENPPQSILDYANKLNATTSIFYQDFFAKIATTGDWNYSGQKLRSALPRLNLHGHYQYQNASCALAALEFLEDKLPINQTEIRLGLANANIAGRFEVIPGEVPIILDVAHNVPAMVALDDALATMGYFTKTHGVFSAYDRKDVAGMVEVLKNRFDTWHVAPFKSNINTLDAIKAKLNEINAQYTVYKSLEDAFNNVINLANKSERIVICGSFRTVEEYLIYQKNNRKVA